MLDGHKVDEYIYNWSISFPIDRWWRQRHNVPFGSKRHRDICFIDQLIEYKEEMIFRKLVENKSNYVAGTGNYMNEYTPTQKDMDDMFDRIKI